MRARLLTPLLLAALLATTGVLDVCPARAATYRANPIIVARVPQPGLMSATLFKLAVRLKPGARAPRQLVFKALNRTRLARGVAVIATARLVKQSSSGTATYVGLVAVFRSKTVGAAGAASTRPVVTPEQIAEIWLQQASAFVRNAVTSFGYLILAEDPDDLWDEDPLEDPLGRDILSLLRRSWDTGLALRWSWNSPPMATKAADAAENDVFSSLHGNLLAYKLRNLERDLRKDFPVFTTGSLSGDTRTPGPMRKCVISYDFTVTPPPYNGLDFQGPPPLHVPAAATSISGVVSDKATGAYPAANPWTGVTWKKSYEGRSRSADPSIAENYWELVVELDGSGDPNQPTGPERTWVYAVSYQLKAPACPAGAKQLS